MKIHSLTSNITLLIVFSLLHVSCKKDPPLVPPIEPPPYQQSIFLSVADSGLTEVYLSLSMTDSLPPRGFEIFRNNNKVLSGLLFGKDTTLVDTTAILNTSYTYQAFRVDDAMRTDSSPVVATKTLDTTSHEFVWTEYTFGDEPSELRDVHIIDQNNIWSIGELWLKDSTGTSEDPYNAVHWDGTQWNVLQIPVRDFGTLVGVFPIRSVYGFSDSDVWMASYADIIQWNGATFSSKALLALDVPFNGQVNKVWGTKNNNMFIVGRNGAVYHFTNPLWHKMVSGTTVDLTDVWGTPDGSTVWACGYTSDGMKSILLEYKNGSWNTLWERDGSLPVSPFDYRVSSVWYKKNLYVAGGNRVFKMKHGVATIHSPSFTQAIRSIRGVDENDIYVVTSESAIWHFNGSTWKKVYFVTPSIQLSAIAVSGKTIAAVGTDFSTFPNKAVVVIGKR